MDEKQPEPVPAVQAELSELEAIEERLAAVNERLATLLQLLAEGKPLGGALVARDGPWSAESAQEFAAIANDHDTGRGSLWGAFREAGFEVIELPEAIYGALTPDTR